MSGTPSVPLTAFSVGRLPIGCLRPSASDSDLEEALDLRNARDDWHRLPGRGHFLTELVGEHWVHAERAGAADVLLQPVAYEKAVARIDAERIENRFEDAPVRLPNTHFGGEHGRVHEAIQSEQLQVLAHKLARDCGVRGNGGR